MSQMSLLDIEAPPKLTREQAVIALLERSPDGIETSEAGAIAHSLKAGRWAHSPNDRCKWCGVDGRSVLKELAKQGLVVENRGRQLWYPIAAAESQVEGYPPDFEGQFGTYNALPAGY